MADSPPQAARCSNGGCVCPQPVLPTVPVLPGTRLGPPDAVTWKRDTEGAVTGSPVTPPHHLLLPLPGIGLAPSVRANAKRKSQGCYSRAVRPCSPAVVSLGQGSSYKTTSTAVGAPGQPARALLRPARALLPHAEPRVAPPPSPRGVSADPGRGRLPGRQVPAMTQHPPVVTGEVRPRFLSFGKERIQGQEPE